MRETRHAEGEASAGFLQKQSGDEADQKSDGEQGRAEELRAGSEFAQLVFHGSKPPFFL
jgi:hypothetical protein